MAGFGLFLRSLGPAALGVALAFTAGAVVHAQSDQPRGSAVALAYDAATDTLLAGYARAVYQSHDEGRSWQSMAIAGLGHGQISSVALSPAARGVMYIAGPELGVLRSEDASRRWSDRSQSLPSRDIVSIAAHTIKPDTVYAVVKNRGVYRSEDAGNSWWLMNGGSQEGLRQLVHSNLAGSMQTGWLYAATAAGIRRVSDCFCLWQDAGKLGTQAYGVTYDPNQPDHVYAVTEKGLFHSADQGKTWAEMSAPSSKVVAVVSVRADLLLALDVEGHLFRSVDQGTTWKSMNA